VVGCGAELRSTGDSSKDRFGGAEAFERADAARVRDELMRRDDLLDAKCQNLLPDPNGT